MLISEVDFIMSSWPIGVMLILLNFTLSATHSSCVHPLFVSLLAEDNNTRVLFERVLSNTSLSAEHSKWVSPHPLLTLYKSQWFQLILPFISSSNTRFLYFLFRIGERKSHRCQVHAGRWKSCQFFERSYFVHDSKGHLSVIRARRNKLLWSRKWGGVTHTKIH